ncbi:hypothetical protein SNE510_62160 [Streptomyces sp. NE5-10]|nr:hypothetical protein SNE510_62160 [Streptomyces sp. NE5-10]
MDPHLSEVPGVSLWRGWCETGDVIAERGRRAGRRKPRVRAAAPCGGGGGGPAGPGARGAVRGPTSFGPTRDPPAADRHEAVVY